MIINNLNKLHNAISTEYEYFDNRNQRILPGDIICGVFRKKFVSGIVKSLNANGLLCQLKNAKNKTGTLLPEDTLIISNLLTEKEKSEYLDLDNNLKNAYKLVKHECKLTCFYRNKITNDCGLLILPITWTGNFTNKFFQEWKTEINAKYELYDLFVITVKYLNDIEDDINSINDIFINLDLVDYKTVYNAVWSGFNDEIVNTFFPNVVEESPLNVKETLYFYFPNEISSNKYQRVINSKNKLNHYIYERYQAQNLLEDSRIFNSYVFKTAWNNLILNNNYDKKFLKENNYDETY